ncbi:MAG: hypothetical protein ACPGSD_09675 [Flavobacteriales bacterium]
MMKIIIFFLAVSISFVLSGQTSYHHVVNRIIEDELSEKNILDLNQNSSTSIKIENLEFKIGKENCLDSLNQYYFKLFPSTPSLNIADIERFVERKLLFWIIANKEEKEENQGIDKTYLYMKSGSFVSNAFIHSLQNGHFDYNVESRDSSYFVTLSNVKKQTLHISFPKNYYIISGKEKQLLTLDFLNKISNNNSSHFYIDSLEGSLEFNNIISQTKEKFFLIKDIKNTLYKYTDSNTILYDVGYPDLSFSNLLLSDISKDKNIEIRIKFTDYKSTDSVQVPLRNLLSHFDCTFDKYVGFEVMEGEQYRTTLVIFNKEYSYAHLFDIGVIKKNIFNEPLLLSANMYAFIPYHNIKELLK